LGGLGAKNKQTSKENVFLSRIGPKLGCVVHNVYNCTVSCCS